MAKPRSTRTNGNPGSPPQFGGGVLADSFRPFGREGKGIAHGIFTTLWAWGYPCYRKWTVIVTIFNLHEEQSRISVNLSLQ
ncbi:MAG: hypothetical protein KKA73_19905, partial [Chloroflexi bacterium]|nr:hypothetical protein [Chloroflexota bacterium]